MAEEYADRPVSRSTLMEIAEDREVIEEGYDFLDEKLVLLAQELLRRLQEYEEEQRRYRETERAAAQALAEAVGRHGLEGVQLYPPADPGPSRLRCRDHSFLGVALREAPSLETSGTAAERETPPRPSAEAEACAERYRDLTEAGAELAVKAANLRRLMAEYRRTEQRAQALDNVILPEVRAAERGMRERLEEAEQEEAVRIRLFAPEQGTP
jgi:V/A-type H+-transporting ATPase subunit D